MFAEIVQLNKMFKTNEFTNIKPKLYQSRVVFVIDHAKMAKKGAKKENIGCASLSEVLEATSLNTILQFFEIDPSVEEIYIEKLKKDDDSFISKVKKEAALFMPLQFSYQVIHHIKTLDFSEDIVTNNITNEDFVKKWIKRLFTTLVLNKPFDFEDEKTHDAHILERLELFCDLDDHFTYSHSLSGASSISFLDIMLISFLSHSSENFSDPKDIYDIAYPIECHNLFRVLTHILSKYQVPLKMFKEKQNQMLEQVKGITNSQELVDAVKNEDLEEVKKILKDSPKAVNSVDNTDKKYSLGFKDISLLHIACYKNNLEIVKFLGSQENINVNQRNNIGGQGRTPIFDAVKSGSYEIVRFLVEECKADVRQATKSGFSLIRYATKMHHSPDHLKIIQLLIKHKAHVEIIPPDVKDRRPVLNECIREAKKPEYLELLMDQPEIDINELDKTSYTPLMLSIKCNDQVKKGSYQGKTCNKPNCKCEKSPIGKGNPFSVFQMIMDRKPDLDIVSPRKGMSALDFACYDGVLQHLKGLIKAGAKINNPSSRRNPINTCFLEGHFKCALELLKHDFNPRLKGETINTWCLLEDLMVNNQHRALEQVLYDPEYAQLAEKHDLVVNQSNIQKLMAQAVLHHSIECFDHLKKFKEEKNLETNNSQIILKTLISFNVIQFYKIPISQNTILKTLIDDFQDKESIELEQLEMVIFGMIVQDIFNHQIFEKYCDQLEVIPEYILKSVLTYMTPNHQLQRIIQSKFEKKEIPQEIKEAFQRKEVLEQHSLLNGAVIKGKPANLLMLLEKPQNIETKEITCVDGSGETVFHHICKNIDTHSSLIFQKLIDICLDKFENENELTIFLQTKNIQGLTASDYCKVNTDRGRLIDQLISKFITGEQCLVIEIEAQVSQNQLCSNEAWINSSHDVVVNSSPPQAQFDQCQNTLNLQTIYDLSKPLSPQIKPYTQTPLFWVDSEQTLQESICQIYEETQVCALIGVDLEYFNAIRSEEDCGIISLMQVSTYKSDYLFDTFMLRDLIREQRSQKDANTLLSLFQDFRVVKILHGSSNDLRYLVSDFGIITVNLFDTQEAFSYIQRMQSCEELEKSNYQMSNNKAKSSVKSIGLKQLCEMLLGVELTKLYQMADWRIRPLPNGMQDYARSDTHYLIPAYFVLMQFLKNVKDESLHKNQLLLDFSQKHNNFIETLSMVNKNEIMKSIHLDFFSKMNEFSVKCQFFKNNFKTIDIKVLNKETINQLDKPGYKISNQKQK